MCSKCKIEKELKFFKIRKHEKDGRSACCSECITEHLKNYWNEIEEKEKNAKKEAKKKRLANQRKYSKNKRKINEK